LGVVADGSDIYLAIFAAPQKAVSISIWETGEADNFGPIVDADGDRVSIAAEVSEVARDAVLP
jgi:hypothetical protein